MSRWLKYSFGFIYLIVGLLLVSLVVIPWQIKSQSSGWISHNTSRTLKMERVLFNPFNMTVVIDGLNLSEQESEKRFLSFGRLTLSLSYRSLTNLALTVDHCALVDPFINMELLGRQEFNFSDFIHIAGAEQENAEESENGGKSPFHFSVNNIRITGGSLDFTDRTSEQIARHTIREFALFIPFIGNVPRLTDEYVQPELRFLLNGAEILADGKALPFHESMKTSLALSFENVDLSYYAYRSPIPLPIELTSGWLDGEVELLYRIFDGEMPKFLVSGNLLLSEVDLRESSGEQLLQLPELSMELAESSLTDLDMRVESLEVRQPILFVSRDHAGLFNLAKLGGEQDGGKNEQQSDDPEKKDLPLLKAKSIRLVGGQVHFRDDFVAGGFQETWQQIDVELAHLSTHPDELTDIDFSLQTARELEASLTGQVGLVPLRGDLALSLDGFDLLPHYPYFAGLLTKAPAGKFGFGSDITFGPEASLQLDDMSLTVQQLLIPFTDEDHFSLADLVVNDGRFDLDTLQLELGEITSRKGDLSGRRFQDGGFSPLALLRAENTEEQQISQANDEPLQLELPWREQSVVIDMADLGVLLRNLNIEDFSLAFIDESLPKKPEVKITRLDIKLGDLSFPQSRQSPFEVELSVAPQGQITSAGTVAHSPFKVEAETAVEALSMTKLNDFLPEEIQTSLEDGQLYLDLGLTAEQSQDELKAKFSGGFGIENFNLRDPLGEGKLLSWDSLNVRGITGAVMPLQLQVKEVSLDGYQAQILVNSNGEVNLASVTARSAEEINSDPDPGPTKDNDLQQENLPAGQSGQKESAAAVPHSSPEISVETITLQGGTVTFTDRNLPKAFNTTMHELGGRVSGLSSNKEMQADIDLRGELENHSPLTIIGKIDPLRENFYTDLSIKFNDIDLVPMTPYAGTYLGYTVDKGKLYLDLSYRIEDNFITAQNRVMIDQFTFGETVESEKATSLPVSLAVALLKDSSGEIHLDVPVAGDLQNPNFSVIGTVFGVLKNLLVKTATAPFALLGSMFGGGEEFSSVTFPPGSAEINDEQQQKLIELAEMLSKRPALTLELSGYVDREQEPEAYRQLQLREMIRFQKAQQLQEAGEVLQSPTEITLTPEEYPEYLTMVYKNADFPRPRNALGMLKNLPPEEMKKLLLANIRAGDEQLKQLATARVHAVRDTLYGANEEIKQQIFLKNVDIFNPPSGAVPGRVEFGISTK